jgi:hypothetical protein
MRLKLLTAAAATAMLGLAAMASSATAGVVVYNEQPIGIGSNYIEPLGGNSFAVTTTNTYYINFTVPANDSLLTIYTNVVHDLPHIGPVEDYSADTFTLFTGTAVKAGNTVTGVGGLVTPTDVLPSLNAKVYDLGGVPTAEHYVMEVTATAAGKLNGSIQLGAVPEPATWAMAILGMGLIGLAARRRRETVAFA